MRFSVCCDENKYEINVGNRIFPCILISTATEQTRSNNQDKLKMTNQDQNQLTTATDQLIAAAEALESVEASESDEHDQYCLDMLRRRIAEQIKIARKYPEHTIQYWDGFAAKLDAIMVDVRYWLDRAAEEATEEATEEAAVSDTHYFAATAKTWEAFETIAEAEKWITAEASGQWHICSVPVSIDTFYLIGQDDNLPQIDGTQIVRESV